MSHTPGPWQWYWREEDGEANCGVFHEKHPGHAYSVARCPRYQHQSQWEADARLIAAAPDLLEALERIVSRDDGCRPEFWNADIASDLDNARAAIAKAKVER